MIDEDKYKEIIESGLLIDHFLLLCNIYNGVIPLQHKRIQGFINLLMKKEYLDDEMKLTDKGIYLIADCNTLSCDKPKSDATLASIYIKCKAKILEITGKTQVRGKIQSKSYPFLPNALDFEKRLKKVISMYKLKDLALVESTLLKFIEKRNEENNWFPTLQYYIFKDGSSQLVTDLENVDDEEETGYKSTQKFI